MQDLQNISKIMRDPNLRDSLKAEEIKNHFNL